MAEEVFELGDGTTIKKFCLSRISDSITNYETIWDILDIVTKTAKLNMIKDEDGKVIDVFLILPKIDEIAVQMALRNFETYHSIQMNDPSLLAEEVLEMRRKKLEKLIESHRSKP